MAEANKNHAGPAARDAGNNVTETRFAYRKNGRDMELSSRDALHSKAEPNDFEIPPSHQPGRRMPNESGA